MHTFYVGTGGTRALAGDLYGTVLYLKDSLAQVELPALVTTALQQPRRLDWRSLQVALEPLQTHWVEETFCVPLVTLQPSLKQALERPLEAATYRLAARLQLPQSRVELLSTDVEQPVLPQLRGRLEQQRTLGRLLANYIAFLNYRHQLVLRAPYYPVYGWVHNSGSPTQAHLLALLEHGPSSLHRPLVGRHLATWLYKQVAQLEPAVFPYAHWLVTPEGPHWWKSHYPRYESHFLEALTPQQQATAANVYELYKEIYPGPLHRHPDRKRPTVIATGELPQEFLDWATANAPTPELAATVELYDYDWSVLEQPDSNL